MESLHGNTQGKNLDIKCLSRLCTDDAPATLGRQKRFVTRFAKFVAEEYDNNNVTSIHCIIHQGALCAKVTDFNDTLRRARQIIIYFRSKSLRHRQLRALLYDCEESLENILCYTPVRWLFQGQTVCRVFNLRREISTFYSTKNKQCTLDNSKFLVAMAFLVNVQAYLNSLKQCL